MSVQLLTIPQVAERLGLKSDTSVYKLIAAGEIKVVDIAHPDAKRSKTRILESDLEEYVARRMRETRAS